MPEFVENTTNAVKKIQVRMKSAQSRHKSYADKRRRPLEFQVGDSVFLKVSHFKGIMNHTVWKTRKTISLVHRTS